MLEEHELKIALLQKALIAGEESGRVQYSLQSLINDLDLDRESAN